MYVLIFFFCFLMPLMMDDFFLRENLIMFLVLILVFNDLSLCSRSFCHVGNRAEGTLCLKTERNPEVPGGVKNRVRGKDLKKGS